MWSGLKFLSRPIQSNLRCMWQPVSVSNWTINNYRYFASSLATIESAVIEQIKNAEGVEREKVTNKSLFDEIGLDSLAEIEVFTNLEEKFKITLTGEDTDEVRGVADLVKVILNKFK
ncbi:unnamed protein product [Blepharisma stoltei]|uniref:Acyl carrier protein n=1 Tax=Blepharisma stoltei TaxID=1481888 RepID=A0AAU9IVM3_9CILI|nr:unnamed protein product [Blepharisma stoltei]